MRRTVYALLVVLSVSALGVRAEAAAQLRPWQISIVGGPSFPTGDFSDLAGTGYHVQGSVGFGLPLLPVQFRADALWQELSDEGSGWWRQIGGLANAIFGIPLIVIQPYGLVGVGYVRTEAPDSRPNLPNESHVTLNAGLGVDFPFAGLGGVLEARYLNLAGGSGATDRRTIPVSIGIKF